MANYSMVAVHLIMVIGLFGCEDINLKLLIDYEQTGKDVRIELHSLFNLRLIDKQECGGGVIPWPIRQKKLPIKSVFM